MRKPFLAAALLALASTGTANAAVVFSDNFDAENGGNSLLTQTQLTNFNAVDGTVDLVANGNFGITCAPGSVACVDLDGGTNNAALLTMKNAFSVTAGSLVTLLVSLSGNQRVTGGDVFSFGFISTSGSETFNNVTVTSTNLGGGSLGNVTGTSLDANVDVASNTPWGTAQISFVAGSDATLQAYAGAQGGDNFGPILDNFSVSVTPASAVPEPATWAMMLVGFFAMGGAMRSRRRVLATA